jgi:hypothetical protein
VARGSRATSLFMSFLLNLLQIVLAALSEYTRKQQQEVIEYLLLENHILRKKLGTNYIVSEYVDCYHACRPHQGIRNVLLPNPRGEPQVEEADFVSIDLATVKCESRQGGLLKHYYHDAA